jgi:hypothetical protein
LRLPHTFWGEDNGKAYYGTEYSTGFQVVKLETIPRKRNGNEKCIQLGRLGQPFSTVTKILQKMRYETPKKTCKNGEKWWFQTKVPDRRCYQGAFPCDPT